MNRSKIDLGAEMEGVFNYDLNIEDVSGRTFRYCRSDGSFSVEPISLLGGGEISGYSHKNESKWGVVGGKLAFLNRDGLPSTIFDFCSSDAGKIVFKGDFLLRPELRVTHHLEQIDSRPDGLVSFKRLTSNYFAEEVRRFGWSIGKHTYGKPIVLEKRSAKLSIGKFCSIAGDVVIALGNHRTDGVTTYPFATLKKFWPAMRAVSFDDHSSKGDVVIGNDVWIGHGVTILSGISIGDGAVVAAQSLVSKDIPPYAIVGGNPARILKYRHQQEDIDMLVRIGWWDWSDEVLNERLPLMMTDMRLFIETHKV